MSELIERISALLIKAERTDNEHEADAYLMKAQALATAASIDIAAARLLRISKEVVQEPTHRTVQIGERGKRANVHLVSLFVVIAHANDAHVDVASNSTYVISYGMPNDLDVVDVMFGSVSVQMVHASQLYVTSKAWQGETYRARGSREKKEFTAQTARAAFYRAYVSRIQERLTEAKDQGQKEARQQHSRKGVELALRDKEKTVRSYHRSTTSARGSWGGYSGGAAMSGSAAKHGRDAASRARLSEQGALNTKSGSLPRGS